jgi:hypothetical protein
MDNKGRIDPIIDIQVSRIKTPLLKRKNKFLLKPLPFEIFNNAPIKMHTIKVFWYENPARPSNRQIHSGCRNIKRR